MPFCNNLREQMHQKEITSYRLAKDLNIHQSTIKNWLDGMPPHLQYARKVADYFGKSVDEMIR